MNTDLLTPQQLEIIQEEARDGSEPAHRMLRMLLSHIRALTEQTANVPTGAPLKLSPEPARTDLTDRECCKLIGGTLGCLLQMAEPEEVRRGLLWWIQLEIRRLTGCAPSKGTPA